MNRLLSHSVNCFGHLVAQSSFHSICITISLTLSRSVSTDVSQPMSQSSQQAFRKSDSQSVRMYATQSVYQSVCQLGSQPARQLLGTPSTSPFRNMAPPSDHLCISWQDQDWLLAPSSGQQHNSIYLRFCFR